VTILTRKPRGGNTQLIRARHEREICSAWRAAGKLCWTDAEIDAAIAERMRPESSRPLFDIGESAAEARKIAFAQADQSEGDRRETILRDLRAAGRYGATRAELSQTRNWQQSSICRAVLELLRAGTITELPIRRKSQFGGAGTVLVLSEFAEGTND
jgi:hypothetical protein